MSLSVCIITFNEAENIERCINSISALADEIVVVDSGSTDDTVRLCKGLGARVMHQKFLGFGRQKQFAARQSRGEWILSLDADEVVSQDLLLSLQNAMAKPTHQVYTLNRLNNYLGKWITHGNWYPDWQTRLWQRGIAQWDAAEVHETVSTEVEVGRLEGFLLHYGINSVEQHRATIEKYSSLAAIKLKNKGKSAGLLKPYASAIFNFLQSYVLKKGFMDGSAGFWISWRSAYAKYLKYKKLQAL